MVSCLVYGFGFAFVSLFMSKFVAKHFLGVQVLTPGQAGQFEWLVQMVHLQARAAGLPKVPEVGIYDSPEMNAFATGPSRSNSLVAFSTGILQGMSRDEIEGVSAHEVTHIQNGDMLTMTLLQGLVNAFVFFFARLVARLVAERMESNGARILLYNLVYFTAQIVFMLLGSIVIAWFSRRREFRADAGSARIAGPRKMIAALRELQNGQRREIPDEYRIPDTVAALGISGKPSGISLVFASHPPLEERIKRLEALG